MGLKFNYTKIKGFEKMDKSEHDNLNLFAWLLMSVHMQTVKEANIDEIFWRLKFLQKIKQPTKKKINKKSLTLVKSCHLVV